LSTNKGAYEKVNVKSTDKQIRVSSMGFNNGIQ